MKIDIEEGNFFDYISEVRNKSVDLYIHDVPYEINYKNNKDYSDVKNTVDYPRLESECRRTLAPTGNLIIFGGWSNVVSVLLQILQSSSDLKSEDILPMLNDYTFDDLYKKYSAWEFKSWIVWDRIKGRGANKLINTREEILVFSLNGEASKFNRLESKTVKATKGQGSKNGKKNRILTNVWSDISPLMYTTQEFKDARTKTGEGYKGQKPVELIQRLIEVYSDPGDVVVDGFCGSGSTAIAAIRSKRNCTCVDINKEACQITRRRVEKEKGELIMFELSQ